jgi:hypothetical protein
VHLVDVATHRLAHLFQSVRQLVASDLEQRAFTVLQTPYQRIEQRVTLRMPMADHAIDQVRGGTRQHERLGITQNASAEK